MARQRSPVDRTDIEPRTGALGEAVIHAVDRMLFQKRVGDDRGRDQQRDDDQHGHCFRMALSENRFPLFGAMRQNPTAMPCRSYSSARSIFTVAISPTRSGRRLAT